MASPRGVEILRAAIFHTPGNPFIETNALAAFDDARQRPVGIRLRAWLSVLFYTHGKNCAFWALRKREVYFGGG